LKEGEVEVLCHCKMWHLIYVYSCLKLLNSVLFPPLAASQFHMWFLVNDELVVAGATFQRQVDAGISIYISATICK